MLIVLVALVLLIASVGVIYYLLKSMGQDGVEVAAPTSCKSGRCGVRNVAGGEGGCRDVEIRHAEADEANAVASLDSGEALAEQPGSRPG